MSTFTSTINKTTPTLASAFAAVAKTQSIENLIDGVTWNGDINFSSLGTDFQSALLALDQKMVLPEDCRKTCELDQATIAILNSHFDTFLSHVSSMCDTERAKAFALMFRYLFYLRSTRVAGKKSRLLFYYLFKRLHSVFPKTCCALVDLVPDFGYFGDLDVLVECMSQMPDVVAAAEQVYIKHLNADCLLIFGTSLGHVTKDQASELNIRLKPMTRTQVREFIGDKRISLAAKWFKREGKHNSSHRDDVLTQVYFPNGGISDLQSSGDHVACTLAKKRLNYCKMVFRHIISALSQCIGVGEQMMCETVDSHRTWADINIETAPAKFMTKYRKALANEELKTPVVECQKETGNRHALSEDRIQCRQNLLAAINKGKLNGAAQDIDRLSKIVFDHIKNGYGRARGSIPSSLSVVERQVIAVQWNDMVAKIKEEIDAFVKKAQADADESGEIFLDPRNVVPVVDTSGSMESARVQDKAIGLGILAASLSSMPGCMISFSEQPQVFQLDLTPGHDVFDHFLTVLNGPTGLSTNIDATYTCMLGLMKSASMTATDFAMMFLTDGQFNSSVVESRTKLEGTALGRMQTAFSEAGFELPRTIFWNLNASSPGFPACATSAGVQLVSGYSQSLMIQVFTGDYKYVLQADGTKKVNVDPWTSFYKAITNEGYDPVMQVVASVGEGCLVTLRSP